MEIDPRILASAPEKYSTENREWLAGMGSCAGGFVGGGCGVDVDVHVGVGARNRIKPRSSRCACGWVWVRETFRLRQLPPKVPKYPNLAVNTYETAQTQAVRMY